MKTIFLFVAVVAASLTVKAQGNLQFNQVLNMSNGTNYTVPEGKVLKIESINFNSAAIVSDYLSCNVNGNATGVTCYYQSLNYLVLGGNVFNVGTSSIYYGVNGASCGYCPATRTQSVPSETFNFPIWLSSGQSVNVLASGIFVSAIEFNIVP